MSDFVSFDTRVCEMSDFVSFDTHMCEMSAFYTPGGPLFRSKALRQRQLHAFNTCPEWLKNCNVCRGILNRMAGLHTYSVLPNGLVRNIYQGTSLPLEMAHIIASYLVGENKELRPVISLPTMSLCDDMDDTPVKNFFLSLCHDEKNDISDIMSVDPHTVGWKTYDSGEYSHLPMNSQMVDDLKTTTELWTLAGTVYPQVAKLVAIFDQLSGNDRKYELEMLTHATCLFFAKRPNMQSECEMAVAFVPQFIENSESRWDTVGVLNLMGFQVTPSTYSANSTLYTLATILATTPLDESITTSANDVPPLQRLIARQQNAVPHMSFHEARRVALVVWNLLMRNRPESSYLSWMCPMCSYQNSNDILEPDEAALCAKCNVTQPTSNGWSCRECKVRNYDFYNHTGELITRLTCMACMNPRGMAHGVWACPVCTFHNKVHVLNCEMCTTAKPIG